MRNQKTGRKNITRHLFTRTSGPERPAVRGITRALFAVEGMSCSSCEQRIEFALSRKPGVKRVSANLAGAAVSVDYDALQLTPAEIRRDIEGLGYRAAPSTAAARKRDGFSLPQLAGIAVILIAGWVILDRTGVFNALPEVNQGMGYGLLVLIGLLTSVHCIAMCGGINLSQASKGAEQKSAPLRRRLLPGLLYNAGRLISYTLIGGAVGTLGAVVSFTVGVQAAIIIAAGGFMILMGLTMLKLFPWLKKFTPRLPKAVTGRLTTAARGKGPFLVGLLNGFMPCGPLQTMQLYALGAGSFLAGALSMFLFALGTVPLMFVFGAVGSLLSRRMGARVMQVSALAVMLLGAAMIARGLSLSGVTLAPAPSAPANIARVAGERQEVSSRVTGSSYEPIIVQAGLPVRWTIQAEAADLNGCNNAIVIPRFNITRKLAPGATVVEFFPEKSGLITFTCWMGMIGSTIKVVDNLAQVDPEEIKTLAAGPGPAATQFAPFTVPLDAIALPEIRDGRQHLKLTIGEERYTPAVGILQRGVKADINFYIANLTEDNYRVLIPAYNDRFEVAAGDNNVGLNPEVDFVFLNWTGLFYGVILVADEPAALNRTEIEARVATLKEEFNRAIGNQSP